MFFTLINIYERPAERKMMGEPQEKIAGLPRIRQNVGYRKEKGRKNGKPLKMKA